MKKTQLWEVILIVPLNINLDKKGGIRIPRRHVVKSIEGIQDEFSLNGIWRLKNPNQQSFTWARCSPFVFCRLNYWLISDELLDLVTNVDILPSIKSDHSANEEYRKMINDKLLILLEKAKALKDRRSIWDWIKCNIRTDSIIFSKRLSQIRQ